MPWLIASVFFMVIAGAATVHLWVRMRTLDAHARSKAPATDAERYRPMLRLLSDEDAEFIADPALRKKLRETHREIFREYLHSLAQDYGRLLAGVRLIMAQSGIDRPDLAKGLVRNRILFAIAICRIEYRLQLHALGIGETSALKLEVQGLVESLDLLRRQFNFLTESAVWGG